MCSQKLLYKVTIPTVSSTFSCNSITDTGECVTDSGQVELGAADYFSVLDAATVQQEPGGNIYEKLSSDKTLIQVAALQAYVKDRDKVPGGFLPEYKVSSTLQSNAINICRHKATS